MYPSRVLNRGCSYSNSMSAIFSPTCGHQLFCCNFKLWRVPGLVLGACAIRLSLVEEEGIRSGKWFLAYGESNPFRVEEAQFTLCFERFNASKYTSQWRSGHTNFLLSQLLKNDRLWVLSTSRVTKLEARSVFMSGTLFPFRYRPPSY